MMDRYVDRLLQGFDGGAFRIGWDAGNGAAGPVVERLVASACRASITCSTPRSTAASPTTIPIRPTRANLEDLKRAGARRRASISASPSTATATGSARSTARAAWSGATSCSSILAEPVLAELPGATIIADVKASQALYDRIAELGGTPLMWKTGHSLIKSKMKETGAPLAGEMSGHIFFAHDYYGFDDAHLCRGPADPRGDAARRLADRAQIGDAGGGQHARAALPGRREPQVRGGRRGAGPARRVGRARSTAPTAPG